MNSEDNILLDNLFEEAKHQQSEVSFEQISDDFMLNVSGSASVSGQKWFSKLFNLKSIIIMLSLLSIVLISINLNQSTETVLTNEVLSNTPSIAHKDSAVIQELPSEAKEQEVSIEAKSTVIVNESEVIVNNNFIDNDIIADESEMIIPVQNAKQEDSLEIEYELQKFKLTKSTTEEELLEFKKKAENAGIQFNYKVKYRNGYIKMVNLTMIIKSETGKDIKDQFYYKGVRFSDFTYLLQWRVDEKGKAIDFNGNGCSHRIEKDKFIVDGVEHQ